MAYLFTEEDTKVLVKLYKQGKTFKEIATAIGRSEHSINAKVSRMQSRGQLESRTPRRKEHTAFAREAKAQGIPQDMINPLWYASKGDHALIPLYNEQRGVCAITKIKFSPQLPPALTKDGELVEKHLASLIAVIGRTNFLSLAKRIVYIHDRPAMYHIPPRHTPKETTDE